MEKHKTKYDELIGTRMLCVAQIVLQIFRLVQVELFINYYGSRMIWAGV